jgi:hypothetical protein
VILTKLEKDKQTKITQISYGEVHSQEVNQVEGKEQFRVEVSNRFAA